MTANFLHGVETIEIDKGPRAVRLVKSSVVGLVGTAKAGAINEPILVTREADFAQFGEDSGTYTIVRELKRLFAQKPTVCIVVNVHDPVKHAVTPAGSADVIGTIDSVTGKRTGMQAFKDCYQLFGFFPKILIAPGFSSLAPVSTALTTIATAIRAVTFFDAPVGITVQQAISGRGPAGTINFNTSSDRAGLCYPMVKMFNPAADAGVGEIELANLSTVIAGAWSRRDQENGYWWSGSNLELLNVLGVERHIEAMINDPNSEANLLNEAGIITVFNSFGTGIRSWGNRSAAWPTNTSQKNFLNVRRTFDVIMESMELSTLQYLDRPLDNAVIDDILESGNRFLRHQQANGAIAGGKVWLNKDLNPPESLANGHLIPSVEFAPYSPLERVTYQSEINIEYLRGLVGKQ